MTKLENFADLIKSKSAQLVPVHKGELAEVAVLANLKDKVLVDVRGFCLGIIPVRELSAQVAVPKPGEKILAAVLMLENERGECVLSLKRADRERQRYLLKEKFESKDAVGVDVKDANAGGLICALGNFEGFLPTSQLATAHYPLVEDSAEKKKEEIIRLLRRLIGQTLKVRVITYEEGNPPKLIFSEKAVGDAVLVAKAAKYKIGEMIEGEITGIVDFGLFINLGEIEGLVHISEVSWDRVLDLNEMYKVGQKIKAKVLNIENGRISLSIKRLKKDPWEAVAEKFKEGEVVLGEVTRTTPYGAFVRLDENIEGLVHISELEGEVKEGEKKKFLILKVEPENRKIALSLKKAVSKNAKKKTSQTKKASKRINASKAVKTKTKTKIKKKSEN
ncbi:S1 RNA-binding domain-containing protein [Candidatus Berkelbacteria bacterium]|nr:S1 RNA-binding domain-containing protein [Candidatus Berkelbacteria bacterium]